MREGKEVEIDPNTIGVIGPCYIEPGSMQHQKYDPNKHGYTNYDFVCGHAQLVTTNALKKVFTYNPNICRTFGAFDVYQSMWMCANDMNTLVCYDTCFDFPNSKESHFSDGKDIEKWTKKYDSGWKEMQKNLEEYQQEHIRKHGYNKWYFE
jgi:hypothetical protein